MPNPLSELLKVVPLELPITPREVAECGTLYSRLLTVDAASPDTKRAYLLADSLSDAMMRFWDAVNRGGGALVEVLPRAKDLQVTRSRARVYLQELQDVKKR